MKRLSKKTALRNLNRVCIYAIYTHDGKVVYVGQTGSLYRREALHRNHGRLAIRKVFKAGGTIKPLFFTDASKAAKREIATIAKFKRRNQAQLNLVLSGFRGNGPDWGCRIRWIEEDMIFHGVCKASRALDCNPSTINNLFKEGNPVQFHWYSNITLEKLKVA